MSELISQDDKEVCSVLVGFELCGQLWKEKINAIGELLRVWLIVGVANAIVDIRDDYVVSSLVRNRSGGVLRRKRIESSLCSWRTCRRKYRNESI